MGDDAGRAVQAVPAAVQPRGLRGRPAAGRSPGPDQAGRGLGPDDRLCHRPKRHATETGKAGPPAIRADLARPHEDGRRRSVRVRPGDAEAESEPKKRKAREGHPDFPSDRSEGQPDGIRGLPRQQMPQGTTWISCRRPSKPAEKTVIDLVFTRNGCRKTITQYVGSRAVSARNAGSTTTRRPLPGGQPHAFGHGLPGLDHLPEDRPSAALPDYRPGDGAPLRRRA